MEQINLTGQRIRLFFDADLDGTISAHLIKLFSGAQIISLIPVQSQINVIPTKISGVLDVFVDCRSRDRQEDIRIDHHASGESPEYLGRAGIVLETKYASSVSLVAHVLGVHIDKTILEEMDRSDSGKPNIFSKFAFGERAINGILFKSAIKPEDYKDFEKFRDNLLTVMDK